jgi:hypothetical protein
MQNHTSCATLGRQTATFRERQSTREVNFALAELLLKEPVCGLYLARYRDGQSFGVRACKASTSFDPTIETPYF